MEEEQRSIEEIERSEAASILGTKGGNSTHKKYGAEHYAEIGKKGAQKRWKNKKKKVFKKINKPELE